MRETLIYLSHLDHEDTEKQVKGIFCFPFYEVKVNNNSAVLLDSFDA